MSKIKTDKKLINKFLNRGVEAIYPNKDALRAKLMSGEKLRVYQGFDPTGPYLHIGHAMGIRALRILQQLGHEVIFLVGDFTSKIGDPDKDNTRDMLSEEIIKSNMAGWRKQASQLIDFEGDNPVLFKRNHVWLSKLKLEDLLKLMSQATVQQMIERDMFDRRLKANNSIGLHEFIYPLMQGYDGVAMEVDMEMGGADQTFNMLMGRHLSKKYLNKEKFVRTNQMMEAPDSLTMSKTKGNGINLADTSNDMYGKAMSYPDSLITRALELLTDVELDQIQSIKEDIKNNRNQMQHKKMMAFEIVKVIKGEQEAKQAQKHFENTIQNKQIPDDIPKISINILANPVKAQYSIPNVTIEIIHALTITKLASSNSEARRLITQGAVSINGKKISSPHQQVEIKENDVLKAGKRKWLKFIN